jgi:hypothetical protein
VTYRIKPGYYALHGQELDSPTSKAFSLFDDGRIAVIRGTPENESAALDNVGPVYELRPEGSAAVPTGRIFVRFAEGTNVNAYEERINQAGYEIVERIAYAPNAAWLRTRSGNIAAALRGIDALAELPDVENVEPQMLMESARKTE